MDPKKILYNLVLTTAVIYALARFNVIPGIVIGGGVYSALVVSSLMGLLNIAVRMMLPFLNIPIRLLTLWITTVILNTAILLFISQFMDPDQFTLSGSYGGVLAAAFGAFIISVAQSIMHKIFA
jgi:uncharacterized membrane protein YvlD (DUF360 family)